MELMSECLLRRFYVGLRTGYLYHLLFVHNILRWFRHRYHNASLSIDFEYPSKFRLTDTSELKVKKETIIKREFHGKGFLRSVINEFTH